MVHSEPVMYCTDFSLLHISFGKLTLLLFVKARLFYEVSADAPCLHVSVSLIETGPESLDVWHCAVLLTDVQNNRLSHLRWQI